MAETRKDKRAPVSLKVRFKSATVDEFIEHYSKDVSRGGIYIKSSQPMSVGTLLKFQFQLKDESALIRGVGRVVWTRIEDDATTDQPAGMGIKFIKMDNESRAMVERIVDGHASSPGTYESGRYNATSAEPSSSPPPVADSALEGSFFPSLPPASLPPPEDRTAVRQATEFLAAAMKEGGTDEAATKEAQEKAEAARRRTEEVEAQRRNEAEAKKKQELEARNSQRSKAEPVEQTAASTGSLPSIIIDPSLEPRSGRPSEQASNDVTPLPRPNDATRAAAHASEPDTEPPPSNGLPRAATTSIPQQSEAPARRTSYVPYLVLAAVLIVATIAFLRGSGDDEEQIAEEQRQDEGVREQQAASTPVAEVAPPAPAVLAPVPAVAAVEETADAQVAELAPQTNLELVSIDVATTPRGAEIWVGEEKRGAAPVSLKLPAGVPVLVRASAPGHREVREELTPGKKSGALKLKLQPLDYLVRVDSTPPGAAINVGGHKGVTPVDLKLDAPPAVELSVIAKLEGYGNAHTRLKPDAFSESDGAMRATLSLTLEPNLPAPAAAKEASPASPKEKPKKAAAPKKKPEAAIAPAAPGESAAEAQKEPPAQAAEHQEKPPEPAPEAAPIPGPKPTPEVAPKPAAPLPDNPFGE